jgi:hypothetical protein
MPIGEYEWMLRAAFEARDWTKYDEDSEKGFVLEVDLFYPSHLHLAHSSLPLAPHQLDIDESILSPFAKKCLQELKGTDKHKSKKLVSTFLPRIKYVVDSKSLALYLNLGLQLTYIHRVITFKQSNFLQKYISYCTLKRKNSISSFKKRLWKLFANSVSAIYVHILWHNLCLYSFQVYGKFIQNVRNYLECKIVNNEQDFVHFVSSPRFTNFKELGSGFVAIFLRPAKLYLKQLFPVSVLCNL